MDFNKELLNRVEYIEEIINKQLCDENDEKYLQREIFNAMNYSILAGGKRLRPMLLLECLRLFGGDDKEADKFMCAIEMIHTYSLVHDDLPAMDNDDYRRGNLTNHKVYGEGMAILAGDGLLTYAFQLMTTNTTATPQQKIEAIQCVATAAGPEGMVGGQAFDMLSENKHIPLEELKVLHRGKTGALFNASVELGLILGNADTATRTALMEYANCLGLLFQITDDIMDYRETTETTGKPVGNDLREGLLTYPLLSIVNDDNKDKLLADIKALNNGGDEQAIIDYVISQGGIDNTLAVADQYCKDALAALDAVRDFPGKEFLVMAVENLADRKV